MPKPWKTLNRETLTESGFFKLYRDRCELPDGRIMPRYYVLEFLDWANIVAFTSDRKLILVRQFRHAAGEEHLEIPGGSTEPGGQEKPERAAARELLEETGYKPGSIQLLGSHRPNPAMQNNWMHTFLALDCELVAEPTPDPFEDLEIVLMEPSEVRKMLLAGKIQHSIVMASLLLALDHLK